MKIGFDAKRAFYNKSGLGNYSRNTIKSLLKYYPENEYFLFSPSIKNSIDFISDGDVQIIEPNNFLHKKLKSYWRSFKTTDEITKNNLDIYHGLSHELPENIKNAKVKTVLTIHDLIFIRYPELYNPIDRFLYTKKYKNSCNNTDKIIAISQQTKNDLINYFNIKEEKISVIYQNCDSRFISSYSNEQKEFVRNKFNLPENYLLYVGTIEERKNALTIVKAIHEGKIDIPLVLVGRQTKYSDKIKEYITKHNLNNRVIFFQNVDNSELPIFYQMAEIFIYPSTFEGFGIPILEALYSKVPVITTKGSCFEETGGKHSIYIGNKNVGELSYNINKILYDNNLRDTMVNEGYTHALKFNEKDYAKNLSNLYKSLT